MNTCGVAPARSDIVHTMNPIASMPAGSQLPKLRDQVCLPTRASDPDLYIRQDAASSPNQSGVAVYKPQEYFRVGFNIVKQNGCDFILTSPDGWAVPAKKWFGIEHWEVEPDITSAKVWARHPVGSPWRKPRSRIHFRVSHLHLRRKSVASLPQRP